MGILPHIHPVYNFRMENLQEVLKTFINDRLLGKFELVDYETVVDETEGTYVTVIMRPVVDGSIGDIIAGLDDEALESLYLTCFDDEVAFEADIPMEDLMEFKEEMEQRLEEGLEEE